MRIRKYKMLQAVSTWLHVLAVIPQLRQVLCQPLPAMRSCRNCSSPLYQHRVRAAGAQSAAPHGTKPGATGSSHSEAAHLYLHHALVAIERQEQIFGIKRPSDAQK